jgi:hypothetical protein
LVLAEGKTNPLDNGEDRVAPDEYKGEDWGDVVSIDDIDDKKNACK